jgi:hypothetical protein
MLRCRGPFVHARRWPGKGRCDHSGRCRRSPQGKPRYGASRCGGVSQSRRGGWSGAGRELKCIRVGELKVINNLGWPILVFITLTNPFGIFAATSHSRTFSATPETEKGVSQLKRGGVPTLSNSELPSSTTACYLCYGS